MARIYFFWATFRGMPTANADGQTESEGSVGKVSVRCAFRYVQIDAGTRRSPSACSGILKTWCMCQVRIEGDLARSEEELVGCRDEIKVGGGTASPAFPCLRLIRRRSQNVAARRSRRAAASRRRISVYHGGYSAAAKNAAATGSRLVAAYACCVQTCPGA